MRARIVERRADVTAALLKVENERLRSALREIELNTRTGDLKTLKLHWIAMTALKQPSVGKP